MNHIDLWLPYLYSHLFQEDIQVHHTIMSILKILKPWKPDNMSSRNFGTFIIDRGIVQMNEFMKSGHIVQVIEYVFISFHPVGNLMLTCFLLLVCGDILFIY